MANNILFAEVESFNGYKIVKVHETWIYNGKVERIWGEDKDGVCYKFKYDEEPFKLWTGGLLQKEVSDALLRCE